jgi:serine/threonine-protein kinase RsbT
VPVERVVKIEHESDIVAARREGRALAQALGFTNGQLAMIATAISEIARNIIAYASRGEVQLTVMDEGGRRGLRVIARDQGPGIPNVEQAMQDGWSTSRGLGLGLPGARRLMDEFAVDSAVGKGTTITMTKWAR